MLFTETENKSDFQNDHSGLIKCRYNSELLGKHVTRSQEFVSGMYEDVYHKG